MTQSSYIPPLPMTGMFEPPAVSDAEWFRAHPKRYYRLRPATLREINGLWCPDAAVLDETYSDIGQVVCLFACRCGLRALRTVMVSEWEMLSECDSGCALLAPCRPCNGFWRGNFSPPKSGAR